MALEKRAILVLEPNLTNVHAEQSRMPQIDFLKGLGAMILKQTVRQILGLGGSKKSLVDQFARKSFSQSGEDLIVDYIFHWLGLSAIKYLDVGANHPISLSNTFYFYSKGCSGVLIEPDPNLYSDLVRIRERDVCLNVGVGAESRLSAEYYEMSDKALSTFSRFEAQRYESYGRQRIEAVHNIPLVSLNDVVEKYFAASPNYVSIDVEGLDYEILRTFDFQRFRPEVFCVETLTYTEDRSERKLNEIIELMQEQGYFVYSDTYLNSIFVEKQAWSKRRV